MSSPRPRRAWILLAASLSVASLGSEFEGCGGGERPPDGRELPMSGGGCVFDTDCGTDTCSALACVAGECVPVGPRTDADGDGFAPGACGGDCDDGDPNVFPGAAEACDARDQDCDGATDEGAPGARAIEVADGLLDAEIVAAGDAFAVIGRSAAGELAGYVLGPDGARSAPLPLVVTDTPVELTSAAGDGGRIVVAFALAGGPPQRIELTREADALSPMGPPSPIGASGDATAIAAHVLGGQAWIAFDTTDAEEAQRWLWRSGDAEALTPLTAADLGPAIADDGEDVVITSGEAELVFIAPDGSPVATRALPGPFATGLPLASGDGEIVAAYRDAFDHNVTGVTATTVRSPSTAPLGARTDTVSIRRVAGGVLVLRASALDLRGWILAPDLRSYVATFTAGTLSPRAGPPARVSAATDASGDSAILSAYEGASVATFLTCDTAP